MLRLAGWPVMTQSSPEICDTLTDAIRFWEPRRLAYNLVLTAITVGWFVLDWAHFRLGMNLQLLLALFVLAVLANVCYCSAYVVDVAVQFSSFQEPWRRWRWVLWLIGMIFAAILASYWINDEIYPGISLVR